MNIRSLWVGWCARGKCRCEFSGPNDSVVSAITRFSEGYCMVCLLESNGHKLDTELIDKSYESSYMMGVYREGLLEIHGGAAIIS